jgi:Abortive infection alpha
VIEVVKLTCLRIFKQPLTTNFENFRQNRMAQYSLHPMSPVTTDLATHISEGVAIKFTTDLITKGVGPALEEFGLTLKDRVHAYRWQNAISIIQDVLELLAQHDLTIQSVSPKVLISALESASLEDDPSLRQYWVALLVSEFVGRKVHPRFPRILADLSPADAQILDILDQQKYKFGFTAFELKQTHQVEEKVVQQTIDNLLYLGLLNEPPRPAPSRARTSQERCWGHGSFDTARPSWTSPWI